MFSALHVPLDQADGITQAGGGRFGVGVERDDLKSLG
jgi:hypothetical protein